MCRLTWFIFIFFLVGCSHQSKKKDIGYISTQKVPYQSHHAIKVLNDLMEDPEVTLRTANGWSVAEKKVGEDKTIWTFPPKKHPGYPSVIKRVFTRVEGMLDISTTVHCAAKKTICDQIVMDFIQINRQLKKEELNKK